MSCDTTVFLLVALGFCFNLLVLWALVGRLMDLGAQVMGLAAAVTALAQLVSRCDAVRRSQEIDERLRLERENRHGR